MDIDECRIPNPSTSLFGTDCKANSYCLNNHGSYDCVCNEGSGYSILKLDLESDFSQNPSLKSRVFWDLITNKKVMKEMGE